MYFSVIPDDYIRKVQWELHGICPSRLFGAVGAETLSRSPDMPKYYFINGHVFKLVRSKTTLMFYYKRCSCINNIIFLVGELKAENKLKNNEKAF